MAIDQRRLFALALILIAAAWLLESMVRKERLGPTRETPAEIASLDFLSVQVRRMIANVLWVRVDDYMHSGDVVHFKGRAIDGEESGASAHLAASEIMALARLVTTFDPTFVRAGVALGNLRMRDPQAQAAATDFVLGMIRGNPEHPRLYALHATLGTNLFQRKDYPRARAYLERAAELYPRVQDAKRLALLGDGPEDDTDRFLLRGVLARLVQAEVAVGEYEKALHYWAKSEGWDPHNKAVQVLMMYARQKAEYRVDTAALAQEYARRERAEQEQALRLGTQGGDEVDEMLRGGPQSRFEIKPQELKIMDLGRPLPLLVKLAVVFTLAALCAIFGTLSGWLRR